MTPPKPGIIGRVGSGRGQKEIHVVPGGEGDGEDGTRTQRFVVCHNPEAAARDAAVRANLVAHLTRRSERGRRLISEPWTVISARDRHSCATVDGSVHAALSSDARVIATRLDGPSRRRYAAVVQMAAMSDEGRAVG